MSKIEKFEDIEAWKMGRELASSIYSAAKETEFGRDFALRDQIRRAAISVMANVAEGFGRRTNRDFANFLYTAKASAMEVISHLYIAIDQQYISKEQFDRFRDGYEKVQKKLVNLIRYLENHPRPYS